MSFAYQAQNHEGMCMKKIIALSLALTIFQPALSAGNASTQEEICYECDQAEQQEKEQTLQQEQNQKMYRRAVITLGIIAASTLGVGGLVALKRLLDKQPEIPTFTP